jgi:hypothetical protein
MTMDVLKPCRPVLLLFAFLALTAAPALGQNKPQWHFKEGDTFVVERIYSQKQTAETKSKIFKDDRTKTLVTSITVKEKAAAGHVLLIKIDSVRFQSAGTAVAGGFDDKAAARMKGCTFLVTVTAQGKLSKLEGYDAFIDKLADKDGASAKTLRALISEESLREDFEDIFNFLPDKPVHMGSKWKRETSEPVPPFGSLQSAIEYVLEEEQGDVLTIGYTIKTSYKPPANPNELLRVIKGELRGEDGKGAIVFDVAKGRLVRGSKTLSVRGDLVIDSMGQQTQIHFTSDNSLKIRVFNP